MIMIQPLFKNKFKTTGDMYDQHQVIPIRISI